MRRHHKYSIFINNGLMILSLLSCNLVETQNINLRTSGSSEQSLETDEMDEMKVEQAFDIISPNGIVGGSFTANWETVKDASQYQVTISKSSDCRNPVQEHTTNSPSLEIQNLDDGSYVICIRIDQQKKYSSVKSFQVKNDLVWVGVESSIASPSNLGTITLNIKAQNATEYAYVHSSEACKGFTAQSWQSIDTPLVLNAKANQQNFVCLRGRKDNVLQSGETELTWTNDQTPPPAPTFTNASAVVALPFTLSWSNSADAVSWEIKLNKGTCNAATPRSLNSPTLSWSDSLSEGSYEACVVAIDLAGNRSAPAKHIFTLDLTGPVASLKNLPASPSKEKTFSSQVEGEQVANYQYYFTHSVSGAATPNCNSANWSAKTSVTQPVSLSYADLTVGVYQMLLCVRGYDSVGNLQSQPTAVRWTLDTQAPSSSQFGIIPPTLTTSGGIISWDSTIQESVKFAVQLSRNANCSSPIISKTQLTGLSTNISTLTTGTYYICLSATDVAGNTSTARNNALSVSVTNDCYQEGASATDFSVPPAYSDITFDIAKTKDGKFLVGGRRKINEDTLLNEIFVARFLSSGSLDATFGSNGEYRLQIPNTENFTLRGVAPGPNGTVFAAGDYDIKTPSTEGGAQTYAFVLKLTSAGALDVTYNAGKVSGERDKGRPGLYAFRASEMIPGYIMRDLSYVSELVSHPNGSVYLLGMFHRFNFDIYVAGVNPAGTNHLKANIFGVPAAILDNRQFSINGGYVSGLRTTYSLSDISRTLTLDHQCRLLIAGLSDYINSSKQQAGRFVFLGRAIVNNEFLSSDTSFGFGIGGLGLSLVGQATAGGTVADIYKISGAEDPYTMRISESSENGSIMMRTLSGKQFKFNSSGHWLP